MTSKLTRMDAIHVDIHGDKSGAPRVQSLGTASISGILPNGHMWTVAGPNRESECCGSIHVNVEGQITYIRCVTSGHTIMSSRGLAKTLQMMADITNTPVIIGHDLNASSTIKDAEYTPSGEFAPVAEVAEEEAPFEVPAPGEVEALMAEHDTAMAQWAEPLVPVLTPPTEVTEDVWAGAGLVRTMTGKTLWTETRNGVTRIKGSTGRFTEWDAEQFTELVDLGVLSVPSVVLAQPLRTLVNRRKRKSAKVNARRVRGGF